MGRRGGAMVSFADVAAAHERIRGRAVRTPVLSSAAIDGATGAQVFFKCENLQNMGAFKFRGAYNALSLLSDEEKAKGVIAFSSGNHAQAVALAGRMLGIKTAIVMPADGPKVKLDAPPGDWAGAIPYQAGEEMETITNDTSNR